LIFEQAKNREFAAQAVLEGLIRVVVRQKVMPLEAT
jgi:hypothetical protein